MKKLKSLGVILTKAEQRNIIGGIVGSGETSSNPSNPSGPSNATQVVHVGCTDGSHHSIHCHDGELCHISAVCDSHQGVAYQYWD